MLGHRGSGRSRGVPAVRPAALAPRGRFHPAADEPILQEFGSDLGHAVRLDQFYPTPAAVDPYHLARRAAFGDYIPPSTSVVMESCFGAESGISTSLIAVVPSAEYEIRKVYPQGCHFVGEFGLCPGGRLWRLRLHRRADGQRAEHGLDQRAHVPDHSLWAGTEIRKQTEFIIQERLKSALEAAGSRSKVR